MNIFFKKGLGMNFLCTYFANSSLPYVIVEAHSISRAKPLPLCSTLHGAYNFIQSWQMQFSSSEAQLSTTQFYLETYFVWRGLI